MKKRPNIKKPSAGETGNFLTYYLHAPVPDSTRPGRLFFFLEIAHACSGCCVIFLVLELQLLLHSKIHARTLVASSVHMEMSSSVVAVGWRRRRLMHLLPQLMDAPLPCLLILVAVGLLHAAFSSTMGSSGHCWRR